MVNLREVLSRDRDIAWGDSQGGDDLKAMC